jgi:flagellar motor switch protein FliN
VNPVNYSMPNNAADQERILEPMAQAFAAGFTQAARASLQKTASVTCLKTEKISLRSLASSPSTPMAMEVQFDTGMRGTALLTIAKQDLARIAGLLAGLECDEEMAISPEFMESNLQFFASGIQATGSSFVQVCGLAVHGNDPQIVNPDGDGGALFPLADTYSDAVGLTFKIRLENLPDNHFVILVHSDLVASLRAQLPQYSEAAPAASPAAEGLSMDRGAETREMPPNWNIDLILDVELEVAVSFGETRLPLRDILKLGVGSVIELEKGVNDPVTMLVNDKPIVRGEVVVVDGNYGVRVLEVESTADRIRSLGR